jgi:hypothetical protein
MNVCSYCNRSFSNKGGLASHEPYCVDNPNRIHRKTASNAGAKKGCIPWNKGKTGVQVAWNKGTTGISGGRASTPDKENLRRNRISEAMKKFGGYRKGSGRGKKGWYKGFFCDSSWELAYVIYCLDHSIQIERNTTKLKYVFENKERSYTPDFLVEGVLTEVKGFKSPQWEAKLKYNPDVRVLYEAEMNPIIEYVESHYGRDFTKLYEK